MEPLTIINVNDLRKAICDVPGNYQAIFQVVGQDGSAWNMCGSISYLKNKFIVTLDHPQLKTLPKVDIGEQ